MNQLVGEMMWRADDGAPADEESITGEEDISNLYWSPNKSLGNIGAI
jgi:hypothetical protein